MHAYFLVSLVSTCNAMVNAECVTNGVVRFFVCCATFVSSVGLLFSTRSWFAFFQAMSLTTPCDKCQF